MNFQIYHQNYLANILSKLDKDHFCIGKGDSVCFTNESPSFSEKKKEFLIFLFF